MVLVGVDAVKRLEADIQDISKNDSICLYKEKGKKTKRPRFDGEESWRVIWSLFEYQHYDDSQYKTPQTQLELIFRKGSCLALELALIILRQGDLNVPFSGGHASRTTHGMCSLLITSFFVLLFGKPERWRELCVRALLLSNYCSLS